MIESAPVWMDWILTLAMWAAGLMLAYVGALRLNHADGGIFLAALRIVGLGWLLYAGRLTYLLLTVGDLTLTWWATVPLIMLSAGSCVISAERVQLARRWPDERP